MKLTHGLHLAYCTNIHRGETWPETLAALERYTLAVRDEVSPSEPYAIGLRLSDRAARELIEPQALRQFQKWLRERHCYVFTINGFPFGQFHGTRVKEQVYAPDWTSPERVAYTNRLFDILVELLPDGVAGSVSTVPGSFKEFIHSEKQVGAMRAHLWESVDHAAQLSARHGKDLHLGLEPEPLCYLETSTEAVEFFAALRQDRPGDDRLDRHLGINYDTCHLAVEFEDPRAALERLRTHKIRLSKLHLSSALKVRPTAEVREALKAFADDTYFHQVIERRGNGGLKRYRDLDLALQSEIGPADSEESEWRIHFHIPVHSIPNRLFDHTSDHLTGVLDFLKESPELCAHLEMETYTWEVMPPELKNRSVVAQLVAEYRWTLDELAQRGFTPLHQAPGK